jgi:hypothetical protein
MQLDNMSTDRQSQTEPAIFSQTFIRLAKTIKETGKKFGRDSDPGVRHGQMHQGV